MSGRVSHGVNLGSKPYLSKCEEEDLSNFLAKAGYGKSRQKVKALATNAICDKGLLSPDSELCISW